MIKSESNAKESYSCQYCGLEFTPMRSDAKYCTSSCRYKSMHQKRLEEIFLKEKEEKLEEERIKEAKRKW